MAVFWKRSTALSLFRLCCMSLLDFVFSVCPRIRLLSTDPYLDAPLKSFKFSALRGDLTMDCDRAEYQSCASTGPPRPGAVS